MENGRAILPVPDSGPTQATSCAGFGTGTHSTVQTLLNSRSIDKVIDMQQGFK